MINNTCAAESGLFYVTIWSAQFAGAVEPDLAAASSPHSRAGSTPCGTSKPVIPRILLLFNWFLCLAEGGGIRKRSFGVSGRGSCCSLMLREWDTSFLSSPVAFSSLLSLSMTLLEFRVPVLCHCSFLRYSAVKPILPSSRPSPPLLVRSLPPPHQSLSISPS